MTFTRQNLKVSAAETQVKVLMSEAMWIQSETQECEDRHEELHAEYLESIARGAPGYAAAGGTVILTGANTYASGTKITGTLDLASASSAVVRPASSR